MDRRAAVLFLHWRNRRDEENISVEGMLAILDEMDGIESVDGWGGAGELPWVALVTALLSIGCGMAEAVRHGYAESDYLEHVVREASVVEADES